MYIRPRRAGAHGAREEGNVPPLRAAVSSCLSSLTPSHDSPIPSRMIVMLVGLARSAFHCIFVSPISGIKAVLLKPKRYSKISCYSCYYLCYYSYYSYSLLFLFYFYLCNFVYIAICKKRAKILFCTFYFEIFDFKMSKRQKGIFPYLSWENDYLFIKDGNSLLCLVCKTRLQTFKKYNVQRHYAKFHELEFKKYDGEFRKKEISKLKHEMKLLQNSPRNDFNIEKKKQVLHASYDVSLEIARSKKSFSDGCIIKKSAIKMAKAFKEDSLAEKFESVPLSPPVVARRVTDINEYLCNKLKELIKNAVYYSFCLDESTDICNISQLIIFIRTIQEDFTINEEMLALASLHNTTKGSDIYHAFIKKTEEFNINFNKCSVIVTDGAPAMTGMKEGFCGLLHRNNITCLTVHCLIHQEALCGKEIKMCRAMKMVTSITNFIRGGHKSLSHRQFKNFLQEVNAVYKNLPLHCEVRWLSAGKCLQHFFSIRKEIFKFLQEEVLSDTTHFEKDLLDKDMLSELAFLTDFTQHLNNLNLNLQGQNKSISDIIHFINGFQIQLNIFKREIKNEEFHHFPRCEEIKKEYSDVDFIGFGDLINEIAIEFDSRFKELFILKNDILLFNNPLAVQIENENAKYRIELCNLRADPYLSSKKEAGIDFFKLLSKDLYPELRNFGLKMASMFGTSYLCESAFSLMKIIKNKHRASLTDDRLSTIMRIATSKIDIDIEELVKLKFNDKNDLKI